MDETDSVFRELFKAWEREEWLWVEALSARATVLNPSESIGWLLRGTSLSILGQRREALSALQLALRLAKGRTRRAIYCEIGHTYTRALMPNNARKWFGRAIAEFPDHASSYVYFGSLEDSLGCHETAARLFGRATECAEGCVEEAWFNLGISHARRGELKAAVAALQRALNIDPAYREALKYKKQINRLLARH